MPLEPSLARKPLLLSVVAPCHNEANNLPLLRERVTRVCKLVAGDAFELILVNDGSTDDTWAAIAQYATQDPHVVGVDLSRNFGHQLALSAGMSVARGQRVLLLDADLQDPPELLPQMMATMDQGADVVYGVRCERLGESWFKKASARAFYRLLRALSDIAVPVDSGDFRLLSRRVVDQLNAMPEQGRFLRGLVAWTGFRQVALPYVRAPRHWGETNFPLARMLLFSLDAITAFSIRPLRVALVLGAGFGGLGLLFLAYTLFSWLSGRAILGWTSLMAALLILGSTQLLVLGIIGEYVGRLVIASKQRPLFIIRETLRGISPVKAACG